MFIFCYLNSCRNFNFFLHESSVSQKTILELIVSNPCVCGQLGVTGISAYVKGRGRVTLLSYFITDYRYCPVHDPCLKYVSYV